MLKFDSETQTMQLIDLQETEEKHDPLTSDLPIEKFLDGCHHVYLDIGTNIGIQVTNSLLLFYVCSKNHDFFTDTQAL